MKRFIFAILLCSTMLGFGSAFFVYRAAAFQEEDVVKRLLDLPAPPPPNPLITLSGVTRDGTFYDPDKPPADDAPISDLMEYWENVSSSSSDLRYSPTPSPKVMQRLMAEVRQDPSRATSLIKVFEGDDEGVRLIKDIYDAGSNGSMEAGSLESIKRWLTTNSPYFSSELEQMALRFKATGEYVGGTDELVALATQDWDRASPIVDRAYTSGSGIERTGALWALYKRSLKDASVSDVDRYRGELQAIVEDRNATPGMRDLAFDALVKEGDYPGRDEWYFTLLGDETLAELRVNGSVYTGLTTIILNSPAGKYTDKMVELVSSDNPTVRRAAIKNLSTLLPRSNDERIIKALLPWLTDRNWGGNDNATRMALIRALANVKVPDSVPGLINLLFEKQSREELDEERRQISNANAAVAAAAAAMRAAANASSTSANVSVGAVNLPATNAVRPLDDEDSYPFRYWSILALQKQADMRAVPALRRVAAQSESWEQGLAIKAILFSGGFTTNEIVDGMEAASRAGNEAGIFSESPGNANVHANGPAGRFPAMLGETGMSVQIGLHAMTLETPSEELVQAAANRIESLDRREPAIASGLRRMVLDWKGTAVNTMMLRDAKRGRATTDAIIILLERRKEIREKQANDVFDLRTGGPIGVGLSGCLLEDTNGMHSLLEPADAKATAMMLACARLLRTGLDVPRVISLLDAKDPMVALAAERYLFSEDSPEARNAVLSRHLNKAFVTGATTHFSADETPESASFDHLFKLFATVSPVYASSNNLTMIFAGGDFADLEKSVREEVIANADLLGIYSYENYFVRMYADRAVFSVQEDSARYRERVLTKEEFDGLRNFLAHHDVGDAPPFLDCPQSYCEPRQLLMVGRTGGRRLFVKATKMPELFRGLDQMFEDFARGKLSLKYEAAKQIPGLQVLFADDDMAAETVWASGADIRLFVTNRIVRKRVQKEIDEELERSIERSDEEDSDSPGEKEYRDPYQIREELLRKREYDGLGWFGLINGQLAGGAQRPAGFALPVIPDSHSVPSGIENWKASAVGVELRTDTEGLYKIVGGRMTKIASGYYRYPIVTTNGRWGFVTRYDDDTGPQLVRFDLRTNRESVINTGESGADQAIVYIPAVNRILIGAEDYSAYDHYEESADEEQPFARPAFLKSSFLLVNPDNGLVQSAPGEYEPLTQQSFRPLQPTGSANEFWAAIPDYDGNSTTVGFYNAGNFGFRPVMKLSRIVFDSLDMWVDSGVIYFVYRGHLLSVPVPNR